MYKLTVMFVHLLVHTGSCTNAHQANLNVKAYPVIMSIKRKNQLGF